MTVPNSLVVIVPSPSLSNKAKASLNSEIYSSVNYSDVIIVEFVEKIFLILYFKIGYL